MILTANKSRVIFLSFFIILTFYAPLKAGETGYNGVGIAPITKDEDSARRVAIQLAKRDAVERAIGAEVRAESIPSHELMQVTVTTSAKLKFEIISEGVSGKVYIAEIRAEVTVPSDLKSKYPKTFDKEDTGYKPLIQKFTGGEINWEDGYIVVTGGAKLKGKDAKSEAEAKRAAQVDAYTRALEIVNGMNIDPDQTVASRIKKSPETEYKLQGLIRGSDIISEKNADKNYQVMIKVPLRGIMGIQKPFVNKKENSGFQPSPKEAKKDEFTGVVVDARGLGLKPALFPQIVDEDGNVVYDVKMVEAASLIERGGAAYVVGDLETSNDTKGAFIKGDILFVSAINVLPSPAYGLSSGISSNLLQELVVDPVSTFKLIAQAAKPRIVIRQGPRPVNTKARKTTGTTRSRIVVSRKAASQIREADKKTMVLRTARVVVITDSMIGGTEGKMETPEKSVIAVR